MMSTEEDLFPVQSFYLFQSEEEDPITAFERMTLMKVNRQDVFTYSLMSVETVNTVEIQTEKSWWDKFCDDGWSHITFGTVSLAVGVGLLFIASGPVGWVSAGLAIAGGGTSLFSGVKQLGARDPREIKFYNQLGDAALSLNNIPGFVAGSATYVVTRNYNQSVTNANWAGLASAGFGLTKAAGSAYRMQKMFNLEVGLGKTTWGTRVRGINASLVEINPKGLEGSHLIPQRHVNKIVEKAPRTLGRAIEKLNNGPLGIRFMTPLEHGLVDSYRYRMLPIADKALIAETYPFRSMLLEEAPMVADFLGVSRNMSPTLSPVVNNLVITGGRTVKSNSTLPDN